MIKNAKILKTCAAAAALLILAAVYVLGPGKQVHVEENLVLETGSSATDEESSGEDFDGSGEEGSTVSADETGTISPDGTKEETGAEVAETTIFVHVCGEVRNPSVYELPAGSRLYEAVDAAGGFTDNAGTDYLNLAACLEDGQQIRIPDRAAVQRYREQEAAKGNISSISEGIVVGGDGAGKSTGAAEKSKSTGTAAKSGGAGLVNINTASRDELMTLPGIGESRADDILSYRKEHGGAGAFQKIEDIKKVPGIKDGAFSKLKDKITV